MTHKNENKYLGSFYAIYILSAIFSSGSWLGWKEAPLFYGPLILFLIFISLYSGFKFESNQPLDHDHRKNNVASINRWLNSLLITFISILPSLLYLAFTWNQEFPLSGDHDYHFFSANGSYLFWRKKIIPCLILLIGGGWAATQIPFSKHKIDPKKTSLFLYVIFFFFFLLWMSFHSTPIQTFSRYPGTGYFFSIPWQAVARLVHWSSTLNADRLANFLSIPIWLLCLRPLILGRWPDASALTVSLFLFYQKLIIYHFTSDYLEPWSFIFVLLATEYLLTKTGLQALHSCLLIGTAGIIKEQAIVILPFFWLACLPWKGTWKTRLNACLIGLISLIPFISFFFFRNQYPVFRKFTLTTWDRTFTWSRVQEFGYYLAFYFGEWGLAGLILFIFFCVWVLFSKNQIKKHSEKRDEAALYIKLCFLFLAFCFQILFFYVESTSILFTGYFRFQFLAFALLSGFIFEGVSKLENKISKEPQKRRRGHIRTISPKWYPSLFFLTFNLPSLVSFLGQTGFPDYTRNFIEYHNMAVYFPIESLIKKAEQSDLLVSHQQIQVKNPHEDVVNLTVLNGVYPLLNEKYDIQVTAYQNVDHACTCKSPNYNLLVPFIYYTNLQPASLSSNFEQIKQDCKNKMKDSCKYVLEESYQNQLVGLFGIPKRE